MTATKEGLGQIMLCCMQYDLVLGLLEAMIGLFISIQQVALEAKEISAQLVDKLSAFITIEQGEGHQMLHYFVL